VVVADSQEIDFGHKLHTGFGVGDPVAQEVAFAKLGVVDIDIQLVKVEGRFEVHRLAEYVQDKNAVIQEDVKDRSEADFVDLLEVVAHMSEL
jgi:glycyl-tRNA synthetase alpha subunit